VTPAELRKHFAGVREMARKDLRKLDKAEELARVHFDDAVIHGRRTRHYWGYVMEILRDKRSLLEMLIRSHRVRKSKSVEARVSS
jgi:hypothetical protein